MNANTRYTYKHLKMANATLIQVTTDEPKQPCLTLHTVRCLLGLCTMNTNYDLLFDLLLRGTQSTIYKLKRTQCFWQQIKEPVVSGSRFCNINESHNSKTLNAFLLKISK